MQSGGYGQRGGAGLYRYGDDQGLSLEVKEALQKQIPWGLGLPSDIAAAVRFLVSDRRSRISRGGVHVNGGMLRYKESGRVTGST